MPSAAIHIPNRRSWIYLGYWILVTAVFLYDRKYLIVKSGLPNFFLCSLFRISLLIAISWINIRWLMPRYLMQKRYQEYFGMTLLLVIGYLLLQSGYDYHLFGFLIGPYRGSPFSDTLLYNFTHTSLYLLLTVALKLSIDWYEQKKVLQEVRVEKLQAEVNYLRSQVNPHFLFNALNNLYALTIQQSPQAPGVVLKLSEMMEYMLYESDEATVPLEKEIRYLNNYLELERLRQGNQADIQLEVTGDPDRCSIPPFLLLPLVENAFKHGISRILRNAYLHLHIAIGNGLTVTIENNKLPNQSTPANGGIGLSNLEKRLQLLYPGAYTLQIDNTPDHYRVHLKIDRLC